MHHRIFRGRNDLLGDNGFHAHEGDPKNLKICSKGKWKQRMLIETIFSSCEGSLNMKKMDSRLKHSLRRRRPTPVSGCEWIRRALSD